MGQTLTHGIYLPDEGERNCYNGLAGNWSILDGAVGTVAEHTSALAGKAPLVHTHGKADITDLFNSANTWSSEQVFSRGMCLSGDRNAYIYPMWAGAASGIAFLSMDATKQFVFGQRATDANNRYVYDATKGFLVIKAGETGGNTTVSVIPFGTDTKLGDSTNKWKTINGLNPGALSIFNPSATQDPIDIPNTWVTDGSAWNTLNVSSMGDGWICITYNNCSADDYILVRFGGTNGTRYPSLRFGAVKNSDNKYYIYALFPVAKAFSNIYLEMLINSNANLVIHHYIPAYGTV